MRLLLHWVLSALALLLVAHFIDGFGVRSFWSALLAAVIVGFVNGTLGFFLKLITLPFTIISFGIFLLVVNAAMLKLAAAFVPGFLIVGFAPAFWGALWLAILNMLIRWLLREDAADATG
jgi:putative membrane protein